MNASLDEEPETASLPLLSERATISRRRVDREHVRVATVTRRREQPIEEQLTHERVEINRVAVNRVVDHVPAVREDGDLTIVPVIEEIVVVERRLVLKEEVHIRRIRIAETFRDTVMLREQEAQITRSETPLQAAAAFPPEDADGAGFTDRTIEMTESREEAVVIKNVVVTEEISLRKRSTDRLETVRDTVRRQDVEIEHRPGETADGAAPIA